MKLNKLILVAGGSGTRMGSATPKQFLDLCGEPILVRTLRNCANNWDWDEIVLVLPKEMEAAWRDLSTKFQLPHHRITNGGAERFESVKRGLNELSGEEGAVAIHDGVRPFVSRALFRRLEAELAAGVGVIPCVELVDSIRRLGSGGSEAVVRSEFRAVQTPQVFPVSELKKAYEVDFHPSFTDDASLFENAGGTITCVDGDPKNIKITLPKDLVLGAHFIKEDYLD